jgi:acetyltransferase-like isoleucine patch superfamily enzyme
MSMQRDINGGFLKFAIRIGISTVRAVGNLIDHIRLKIQFWYCGVQCVSCASIGGIPIVGIGKNGEIKFGKGLFLVNNQSFSTLGVARKCKFLAYENAEIVVGNRVAMSNAVIVAVKKIEIGDNVLIGGGVTIVDSDFHSLDSGDWFTERDGINAKTRPVKIGNNVFIGMNSLIMKGVIVGDNSVIGAGSVVTTNVPSNQIWAGNPAKFIKENL